MDPSIYKMMKRMVRCSMMQMLLLVMTCCAGVHGAVVQTGSITIYPTQAQLHIQEGAALRLTCNCTQATSTELVWERTEAGAADGSYSDSYHPITTLQGFTIRNVKEEPSGYRETQLIKESMRDSDSGMYRCYNEQPTGRASYQIEVKVVKVLYRNLTVPSQNTGNPHTVHCNISGLNNPSSTYPTIDIDYEWLRDGQVIGSPISHDYEGIPSRANREQGSGYTVTSLGVGRSSLTIQELYREHTGYYTCLFRLRSENINVSQSVHIDARYLAERPLDVFSSSTSVHTHHCTHIYQILLVLTTVCCAVLLPR